MQRIQIGVAEGPVKLGLITASLVFGAVMTIRMSGGFMSLELGAYDRFLSWRPSTEVPTRVVLLKVGEADIERFGFPIPNDVLATALHNLSAMKPRAIGVDIYRPAPMVGDVIATAAWKHLNASCSRIQTS